MDGRPILTGGFPQMDDGLSIANLRSSVIFAPAVFPCHLALTLFGGGSPHLLLVGVAACGRKTPLFAAFNGLKTRARYVMLSLKPE